MQGPGINPQQHKNKEACYTLWEDVKRKFPYGLKMGWSLKDKNLRYAHTLKSLKELPDSLSTKLAKLAELALFLPADNTPPVFLGRASRRKEIGNILRSVMFLLRDYVGMDLVTCLAEVKLNKESPPRE